ncbi:MAG TPA: RcnB family protein [Sphingomonadaceae bacterium]|nr:RcnB family protein [Sphingomonadaceae bacterium]
MRLSHLLKSSGLAAIAAALAATALPAQSVAQDREGWSQRDNDRRSARSERSSGSDRSTRSSRSSRSDDGDSRRSESRSAESRSSQSSNRQSSYTPPRRVDVPASRVETRSAQGARGTGDSRAERSTRNRSYSDGDRNRTYTARRADDSDRTTSRASTRDSYAERRFGDQLSDRERARVSRITEERNRNYRDGDRNRSYSDRDRNQSYSDRNGSYRDGYRDGSRDYRRWDRRWRDSDRYDWHRYRDRNRSIFHIGFYYAPYRNYYYRRLSIGYFLDSLFFASRYWIDDPWRYRLPEVYGPYRWVRYYDDVLLVDIYTGEVVDVIYDFFW